MKVNEQSDLTPSTSREAKCLKISLSSLVKQLPNTDDRT
uniref:Uncharacterized protein n=1 Tax=Medicago truncatula TaxID=3880 RepID=Q2HSA4_MEDTR|nr:hypothetical protein MtrDRAFT_AC151598g37v2 [Medicago truncatula]